MLAAVPHHELDGFNLLGVVANPRTTTTVVASASPARRLPHVSSTPLPGDQTAGSTIAESIHALESTISQVTEQIDALNVVFDQWSRQYLGTLYYEDDTAALLEYLPPTDVDGQLTELPPELAELTLHSVQKYLEQCGILSHQFRQRAREQETWLWHESISPDSELGDLEANEEEFMKQLEATIPPRFFQTYLDLTDSKTFEELLVASGDDGDEAQPLPPDDEDNNLQNLPEELTTPTREILRLPPPDTFTGLLDKVELALLQQVRSKSIAFFHETNRFGQLKEWIAGLVEEVRRVRQLLDSFTHKSVVAWELIPLLDKQRQDLVVLNTALESANEVIRCKGSIGGMLSANDDLGAAEQIQYGRMLLLEEDGELHKLQALRTVQDQFTQYESLVVANLGEELVEVLLEWKSLFLGTRQDQSRVRELVRGLQMCSAIPKVGRLYSNRLLDVIRMTVRTTVGEFSDEADSSVKVCVTSMTLDRFVDCLDMLFEQLMDIMKSASGVKGFFDELDDKSIVFTENDNVAAAAELSSKSIAELLRLRKEAHSLVNLSEMKRLWDVNMRFTLELEELSSYKATGLRSTLLAQAKAFVERQHESNMSSLVAALDSERWTQCDVSAERQFALTQLCTGRAVVSKLDGEDSTTERAKSPDAEVEGTRYKVVWSCLLLVEMVLTNIKCAAHFPSLATNVVGKVTDLLRLFNSRSTQLVLGAGAIHSAARLKSINAKHLSLVTQCLGMTLAILPYVRARLMAHLPPRQHGLLNDLDKIKKEYGEHNEKVLNKFVSIIGGIVEHGLAPRIANTDFDARARNNDNPPGCCVFLEGVSTNTRKMHQVLNALLPPDHLRDVFSRIFAFIDQLVPSMFKSSSQGTKTKKNGTKAPVFSFPTTDAGKERMLLEVQTMIENLNALARVRPWEFTAIRVLERQLDYELPRETPQEESEDQQEEADSQETLKEADAHAESQQASETMNGQTEDNMSSPEETAESAGGQNGTLNGGDLHNHKMQEENTVEEPESSEKAAVVASV